MLTQADESLASQLTLTVKRRVRRLSSDEVASRILREQFGDYTPDQTDGIIRNGRTLRQAIKEARKSASSRNGRISTKTFSDFRKEFAAADSAVAQ